MTEVSVVIPTLDRPAMLRRAVASVLAQEGVALECIVVDDGSRTPAAAALGSSLAPHLRVIRHERPRGVATARNAGIAAARAEWVAFIDDDDLWAPHKLRTQLAEARARGAAFAVGAAVVIDERGTVVQSQPAPDPGTDFASVLRSRNVVPGGCSNLVARTSAVRDIGGFDPAFSILADWDLHLRLAAAGPGAAIPDVVVAYTVHRTNMHYDETGIHDELARLDAKHSAGGRGLHVDPEAWLRWRLSAQMLSGQRARAVRTSLRLAATCREPRLVGTALTVILRADRRRAARRHAELTAPPWLSAS